MECNLIIEEDVSIRIVHMTPVHTLLFRVQFHASFIKETKLRLSYSELDGTASGPLNDTRFPSFFTFTLFFEDDFDYINTHSHRLLASPIRQHPQPSVPSVSYSSPIHNGLPTINRGSKPSFEAPEYNRNTKPTFFELPEQKRATISHGNSSSQSNTAPNRRLSFSGTASNPMLAPSTPVRPPKSENITRQHPVSLNNSRPAGNAGSVNMSTPTNTNRTFINDMRQSEERSYRTRATTSQSVQQPIQNPTAHPGFAPLPSFQPPVRPASSPITSSTAPISNSSPIPQPTYVSQQIFPPSQNIHYQPFPPNQNNAQSGTTSLSFEDRMKRLAG